MFNDIDFSKPRLIDSYAWIRRLKEEYEQTENPKRKTYIQIQINSIMCQPDADRETVEKYLENLKK